ncbi:MAG: hypothetical protein AAGI48_02640 [Verrucomicrobiota bacterium]
MSCIPLPSALIAALLLAITPSLRALEIQLPELEVPIPVSLPENHEAGKSWPAVFSYHGFKGRPTTHTTRSHTGPDDWIVVGMTYVQRGKYRLNPDDLARELRVFRRVRDQLAKSHGLDPRRIVVTGFSKGGWMTDALLQSESPLLGGAILMAGHLPSQLDLPSSIEKDTPVFIGVGRRDPNYIPSLKAMVFYRGKGARTTFEAWPDLGHDFPRDGSTALREWYQLLNDGKPDDDALEKEFKGILEGQPLEAWQALGLFKGRPFTNTSGSPWPERIDAEIAELEKLPEVAREARLQKAHRNLLGRELKMRTMQEIRSIDAAYGQLLAEAAGSPQLEDIQLDHRRLLAVLKQAEETPVPQAPERPTITPEPPSSNPVIPLNPLVR